MDNEHWYNPYRGRTLVEKIAYMLEPRMQLILNIKLFDEVNYWTRCNQSVVIETIYRSDGNIYNLKPYAVDRGD